MTADRRFERDLGGLLADLAMPVVPAYRDDIVRAVAGQRQRPAWTFPERWIPVDITTQRAGLAPIRWRPIALLAIVALLVAAAVAIGIGSQHRLPPPFGPARNGVIAYFEGGDILVGDPVTGTSRLIIGGPNDDGYPLFSRDGTKIAFLRTARPNASQILVANADGTGARPLTNEPLDGINAADWSADGRFLVVSYLDRQRS